MAKNRKTTVAPRELLGVTKATLADLVWWFAFNASPDRSREAICKLIIGNAISVAAPTRDIAMIERAGAVSS